MFLYRFYYHHFANSLPFYNDLTSQGKQFLFQRNHGKTQTLSLSFYFFGFHGTTAIDQELSLCAGYSSLQKVLEKYFPNHMNMEPFSYESFFVSPWASSVEAEQNHKVKYDNVSYV